MPSKSKVVNEQAQMQNENNLAEVNALKLEL